MARRGRARASPTACSAAPPIASQPHPERKSVLVELNALLLDRPAGGVALRLGRPPARLHLRRPQFVDRARPRGGRRRLGAGPRPLREPEGDAAARADGRAGAANPVSAVRHAARPAQPVPRLPLQLHQAARADAAARRRSAHRPLRRRSLGLHATTAAAPPRVHFVQRWRLEKKDPAAALSEPVQPIVYWIDRNMPEQYRGAVRDGILEWNKAFEQIGFKDAIQVEIQPDDADWSTVRRAATRRCAGSPAPTSGSRSARRRSIRAPARSSTPTSRSPSSGRAATAGCVREDLNTASAWPAFDAYQARAGPRSAARCTFATDALAEVAVRPRPAASRAARSRRTAPRPRRSCWRA